MFGEGVGLGKWVRSRPTSSLGFWVLAVCLVMVLAYGPVLAKADVYEPPSLEEPELPGDVKECPVPSALGEEPKESAEIEYGTQAFNSEFCEAMAYRLDRIRERAFWGDAELRSGKHQNEELLKAVEALKAPTCTEECTPEAEAIVAAIEASQDEVQKQGELLLQAVLMVIGVMFGLFVLSIIRKVFDYA